MAALVMVVTGFALYWPQVRHGGFLIDDWYISSQYQAPAHSGFLGLLHTYMSTYGTRPVSALYLLAAQAVFGLHMSAFLAWSVVLAAISSTLLFVLLRQLGVERIHAAVIAGLVLVFPAADSTVLWIGGSNAHVDMALYFAGAITALHGLTKTGRAARRWHAGAAVLYLLSMLFAEPTTGLVLLSVFLYRFRTSWRRALRCWAVDVAAVLVAVGWVGSRTKQQAASVHDQLNHVHAIFTGASSIVERIGRADGPSRLPGVAIVALALVASGAWLALRRREEIRNELRHWLTIGVGGAAAIVGGYLIYIPAASYYTPTAAGVGNRVNAVAAPGFVILLYAMAAIVGLGFRGLPGGRSLSAVATVAIAALIGGAWIGWVSSDQKAYAKAFSLAEYSLHVLDHNVHKPPPRTTIYTFGLPKETKSVVPVWDASWDLQGAVRTLWHDHTLSGIPSPTISAVHCNAHSLRPVGGLYTADKSDSAYGHAVFVYIPTKDVRMIDNRTECNAAVRRYVDIAIKTPRTLPGATAGKPYLRRLRATGGTPPYQWLVTEGALPPGMSLWSTGQLTGVPGAAGTFRFSVSATDGAQAIGRQTATYVLRIAAG